MKGTIVVDLAVLSTLNPAESPGDGQVSSPYPHLKGERWAWQMASYSSPFTHTPLPHDYTTSSISGTFLYFIIQLHLFAADIPKRTLRFLLAMDYHTYYICF